MKISDLRVNGSSHPLAVDDVPRFTWKAFSDDFGVLLPEAQLEVRDHDGLVWDSGRCTSTGVPALEYAGPELRAKTAYTWRVRAWDQFGDASEWSREAAFETGLRGEGIDGAQWIRLEEDTPVGQTAPVQYLRHEFTVPAGVRRARSFSTALGWYHLRVNGADATGPGYFPGFTSFDDRVEYQVRDITSRVREGRNVVGAILTDGRFRGRIGAGAVPSFYGNRTAVIVRLEIELEDGRCVSVVSGRHWEGGHGSILTADTRAGEIVDARLRSAWDEADGRLPSPLKVIAVDEARALVGERVQTRQHSSIPAVARWTAPSGKTVVDFGQNTHGFVRITARGPRGSSMSVHHSEVLDRGGEVDIAYLAGGGEGPPTFILPNVYTFSGNTEAFEPLFCTQGFRYASLDIPDGTAVLDIACVPVHADLDYHSEFSCSDELVNRFHHNVLSSMQWNFIDVPSDCPTRERSGWTGDAEVFAPTALLLADAGEYLANWLVDARLQQHSDGTIPDVVPMDGPSWREGAERADIVPGLPLPPSGSAGWGDAVVIIPWEIYQATGAIKPLRDGYEAMTRWVERYARMALVNRSVDDPIWTKYVVNAGYHWGEWLEPVGEGDGREDLLDLMRDLHSNPRSSVATAYFEHSSRLLSHIAELLGFREDAARFLSYADGARYAWQQLCISSDGSLLPDAQATYVRALDFDLVPSQQRPAVAQRLVDRIRARGTHLGTGFLTTGVLLKQLSAHGHDETAVGVLTQTKAPSWLDQVRRGATSIWETWTGLDASGNPTGSYNHYALGAAARWLYENLAGLQRERPGWQSIRIDPVISPRFTRASASIGTPFGAASSAWERNGNDVTLNVQIPVGATATLRLRDVALTEVLVQRGVVDAIEAEEIATLVRFGSGTYTFEWRMTPVTVDA